MAGGTLTTVDSILKEYYLGPVQEQQITSQIQLCIQTSSFYGLGGEGDVLPY